MTVRIPGQVGWKQTNRSDVLGSLWATWNIDLQSNLGKLRVAPRLKINTSTQGVPVAFARYGGTIFTIAGTTIYRGDADDTLGILGTANGLLEADTSTNATTDYADTCDLLAAWDVLFATSPTKLKTLNANFGGTWTDRGSALSSSANHKLLYFPKFDRVYFTDSNAVKSITEGYAEATSGDYYLSTPDAKIVDMKNTRQYIWLAVQNANYQYTNGVGRVLQWDGISNEYRTFKINGTTSVVALVIDEARDIPLAMGNNGILYEFNGSGFSEVGRLPFAHNPKQVQDSTYNNTRFIHPNGAFFTQNRTVLALINGVDSYGNTYENAPSGIWEFDLKGSATHKYSFSYDPRTSSVTDYGQNKISAAGALALMDVYANNSSREGTLLAGATYYTNASSTASAIFFDNSLDTVQKYGYWISVEMFSGDLDSYWQEAYVRHSKLLGETDNISMKYRFDYEDPTEITITWVNETSFTTSTDVESMVGYEVEVLHGTGSGKCAHITAVTENAGTYTVTLDDSFEGVTTGTAVARVQNWIKAALRSDNTVRYSRFPLSDAASTVIQVKVCLQCTGEVEIVDAVIPESRNSQTS